MPLHDMLVVGFIVTVFLLFGIVLAGTCWYCRPGADRQGRRAPHDATYPSGQGLITDDD